MWGGAGAAEEEEPPTSAEESKEGRQFWLSVVELPVEDEELRVIDNGVALKAGIMTWMFFESHCLASVSPPNEKDLDIFYLIVVFTPFLIEFFHFR